MKKLVYFVLLLVSTVVFSQSNAITYQAVIYMPGGQNAPGVNVTNVPMSNKNICLQFSFVDASNRLEYQEEVKVKTDEFGMVNITVGQGTQTGGYASNFSAITWTATAQKNLQVSLDATGLCSRFEELSNEPIASVPFANAAIVAGNVTGVVALVNGGTGATTAAGARANLGIENVDNTSDLNKPVSNATKIYVDTAITGATIVDADATTKGKLQLAGDLSGTAAAPTVPGLALKENVANKSTDIVADAASTTKYPSVKVIKDYVDALNAAAGVADGSITSAKIADATIVNADVAANAQIDFTKLNIQKSNILGLGIVKGDLGLGNVDNTSDAAKPVSTATQAALDLKANAVDLAAEVTRATAAETTLTTNLGAEVTRATAAEATLTTNVTSNATAIAAEVTRATAAETTLTTNLAAEVTRATAAEATLTTNVTANATAIAAETTRATAAETTLTTNLAAEVTRATAAEATLTTNVTANATAIAAETTRATAAETTLTTNLAAEVSRATAAEALKAPLASPTFTGTVSGITQTMVGLSNVDNTSDANKPVSTATQTALDLKENLANKSTDITTDAASTTKYPSVKLIKDYVDSSVSSGAPDATNSLKGKIQLAGDLTGNADEPRIASGSVTSAKILDGTIATIDIADAAITYAKIQNVAAGKVLGNFTGSGSAGVVEEIATTGTGDVVRAISPTFTGTPTLPTGTIGVTQSAGDNTTALATTAFVTAANATNANLTGMVTSVGNATTVVTNANLTGEVTSTGNATTVTNAAVIGKVLTGYTVGAGTVAATDTILQAIQKIDGNDALKAPLESPTFTGTPSLPTGTIGVTQSAGDNTTALATTAFVTAANATNANLTGPITSVGNATTITDAAVTNPKLDKANIPLSGFGAATADVDLGSNKLTNVTDPSSDQDAATKKYVDDSISSATIADATDSVKGKLQLAGDLSGTAALPVVATGAITTAKLATDAVETAKIKDAAVETAKIKNSAVTTDKITDANVTTNKLADAAVTSAKIADGTIVAADLADSAVTNTKLATGIDATKLADGSVTNTELQYIGTLTSDVQAQIDALSTANSTNTTAITAINTLAAGTIYLGNASNVATEVTPTGDVTITNAGVTAIGTSKVVTAMLATNAVTTDKITNANITTDKLAADAVTTAKILDGTIVAADIATDAVEEVKIKASAVTSSKIADGTIVAADIATDAVEEVKIKASAVTSAKIADGTIVAADIATDAVEEVKIKASAVTSAKIADGTIIAADIADSAVTNTKLATGIDATKLADGSVTNTELQYIGTLTSDVQAQINALSTSGSSSTIAINAINTLADGKIYMGNASNEAIEVTPTGDVTITNAGVTAIGTSKVVTAMIATNAVTTDKITNANVTTDKIAADAVTTAKLADDAVTSAKIKDGEIATLDIANAAITYAKIQNVSATDKVLGRISTGAGVVEEIATTGSGNVVRATSPTLVTPVLGAATGTSLSVSGQLTSTVATGTAPLVVTSTTPVANLNIGGNASTATKLATARKINTVDFDGSADITVTAAAGTLTGDTLNSTVVSSSLTSVGTITTGTWNGTTIAIANGGTGSTTQNFVDLTTAQTVAGAKTFSGNTSIGGTLAVTGATTLNGNTSVSGANTFTVGTGATALGGTLAVTGATTLNGNTSVSGSNTLTVGTGATTLGGTLGVTGATSLSSTLAVTGNTTVGGTLGVTGNTTLSGTLAVTGATTLSSTLGVTGDVAVSTDKFKITASSGNTEIAGTLKIAGGSPGAGKLLVSDASGLASWNSNPNTALTTVTTATYPVVAADKYVIYSNAAAGTITLPDATSSGVGKGKEFIIKNITSFGVTVNTTSSQKIVVDSANSAATNATLGVEASNNWIRVISDGTQWIAFRALF